jgi:hypothetical protein
MGSKFFVGFISVSVKAHFPNVISQVAVLIGTADVRLVAIGLMKDSLADKTGSLLVCVGFRLKEFPNS